MITIRPSDSRGKANFGWLDSKHTFSFGRYFDQRHMGFRSLRVINEDIVAPGQGFGEHPHHDMEIVSYVLSGALAHKDTLGNVRTIAPGEVQRMSAGDGIEHSEFNPSASEPVHFLQIWIMPASKGERASYDQRMFPIHTQRNRLHTIAAGGATAGGETSTVDPLHIGQDARILAGALDAGARADLAIAPNRHAWVQVARGAIALNGTAMQAGDGAAVSDETTLAISATTDAELLVFDLA